MIGGRRAEDWLALMEGPDANVHREAFERWYADPVNASTYDRLRADHDMSPGLSMDRIAQLARPHDAARTRRRQYLATAATILVALSAGAAWFLLAPNQETSRIAASGQSAERRLDDGTLVALFDGARIDPAYSASERVVHLSGGRARFTVAHDANRPFRVVAGNSVTTALGTIFEVDLRGAAPRVRLLRGSVEIASREGGSTPTLRLVPGETAEVGREGPRLVPAMTSPVHATMLDADGLPLGAVLDRANRGNARKIGLADPALAALRLSGRFDLADGDKLARKLAAALDLTIDEGPAGPILGKRKK